MAFSAFAAWRADKHLPIISFGIFANRLAIQLVSFHKRRITQPAH
jgi:hypothetical protein